MSENDRSGGGSGGVLVGRDLGEWCVNSEEVKKGHEERNGRIVRTRFPPEPNGYLHIGHAKSMNMNFQLAFDKLGVEEDFRRTIFRYDDTNPDAESEEYIDSLRRDVEWLGWKPERTTYSSQYFEQLYQYAIVLIEKGLAYVCDMTKEEMEVQRDLAQRRAMARMTHQPLPPIPSPDVLPGRNRNTSVQRNLELFENMRLGLYEEGHYTLRLKMDIMESNNPNMYDLVAYRIKYTSHPHIGDAWCIYPAYDFTHGICDSIEDIDYSICTLEFETRREPYYWILWALDLYKPQVYEMSRLNVEYTVLSKRRLIKLVDTHKVRGWNDPRMPTLSGLRRRGYTPTIINTFCQELGVTRASNVVELDKLEQTARTLLAPTSTRAMVCLHPIMVQLIHPSTTTSSSYTYTVDNSPTDPSLGSHTVTLTPQLFYIDSSDFSLEEDSNFYGLTPHSPTGLKYHGGSLSCQQVIFDDDKKVVTKLICTLDDSESRPKVKSYITWVPSNAIPCEVRLYDKLFTVPVPTDLWEQELNESSELICSNALIDPSVSTVLKDATISQWHSNPAFQLERFGYFVVDIDTTTTDTLVLNRTVSLKVDKQKASSSNNKGRKEKQAADALKKELKMKIQPIHYFQQAPEHIGKYSQYNEKGIPTHTIQGETITKSMMKKLAKELLKHEKAYNAHHNRTN